MKAHRLKTWQDPFYDVSSGKKTFEIRRNDRGFEVGDLLVLDLYNNLLKQYEDYATPLVRKVTYVMSGGNFGVPSDFVVMGIEPVEREVERVALALVPPRPSPPSPAVQAERTTEKK